MRFSLGWLAAGNHTIVVQHAGPQSASFFFDFLEVVYPSANLPEASAQAQLALATDWDTYHSQSLPAERTAWLINKLGFKGRVNHYVGAMSFYEIVRPETQYASLTLTLTPIASVGPAEVILDIASSLGAPSTKITHLVLADDTPDTVALALAGLINIGTNVVWAIATGNQMIITARSMGTDGNGIILEVDADSRGYVVTSSSIVLSGGVNGTAYDLHPGEALNSTLMAAADYWRTDLLAEPPLNRAARDWHQAYFKALRSYGIDVTASFSTELLNGDPSLSSGIAQRYFDGTPVVLNTPAIQTNFSPATLAFWQSAYLNIADLQAVAGNNPYLQSGELQWWYFPKVGIGMPFYDSYTAQQFEGTYGAPIRQIMDNDIDPNLYANECAFLPGVIGRFSSSISRALRSKYPGARYEVLYPTDTNDSSLNRIVNYPASDWTPANLTCLKTESFTFTGNHNLDQSTYSMSVSAVQGFTSNSRSHLIGIGDSSTPWMKECDLAQAQGMESVVLFALDQFCLIGYPPPPYGKTSRTVRQG